MDVKKIVLLIGALAVAATTAVMAKNMFSGAGAPQAEATPVTQVVGSEVLVATRALPVGTIIDAEALKYQVWPQGLVQPAYYVKGEKAVDPATLVGSVVRAEITAGQPLTQGALLKPGERGFLAAALGSGMRAVTVPVSVTSSVAGFIFPGDRVDLMLTQEVAGGGDGEALKVSETVLRNIRVLATDQRTSPTKDEKGNPVVEAASTVTLEVTPKMAEKIQVAQTIGSLSLSLRAMTDNAAELEQAIASGEVSVPEGDDATAEKRMLLAAARPSEGNSTFTVGADVSRYERSTVPSKPTGEPNQDELTAASLAAGKAVRVARGNNVTVVPVGAK